MNLLIEYKDKYLEKFSFLVLAGVTILLRFINLSYSEFQGDEIRALYNRGVPLISFLLSQKKGPVQFIITYLISLISTRYDELLTRLPFALAGTLSVFVLYFLVKELYGKKVGLISAFLFSINGLFIAFSRIVQYQSFTFLFYLLSLFCFIKLRNTLKSFYLFLGFIFLGLGALSHYDAVFVIIPSFYFICFWFKNSSELGKNKFIKLIMGGLLCLVLVSLFYIPFFVGPSFSTTQIYLLERFKTTQTDKNTNTLITYNLYNPFLSVYFLFGFAFLGVFIGRLKLLPIFLWFILPFLVLNFAADVPGTHIYNYIIPLIIMASYGSLHLYSFLKNVFVKGLFIIFICLCFSFLIYQSYKIFVDHSIEYPWFSKQILLWNTKLPSKKFNLSVFGFPYNRKLKEVNAFLQNRTDIEGVTSNEGSKIVRFYVNPELLVRPPRYNVYVYIYGAQSLVEKKSKQVSYSEPVATFFRNDVPLSEVYLIKY